MCNRIDDDILQVYRERSNLRRRPVEQGNEGLYLMIAERWSHYLPLAVMILAYTVICMSTIENHRRECKPSTVANPFPVTSLVIWFLSALLE